MRMERSGKIRFLQNAPQTGAQAGLDLASPQAQGGQGGRCVAGLVDCLEQACRHWSGGRCSWTPPAPERQSRGARVRLGRIP